MTWDFVVEFQPYTEVTIPNNVKLLLLETCLAVSANRDLTCVKSVLTFRLRMSFSWTGFPRVGWYLGEHRNSESIFHNPDDCPWVLLLWSDSRIPQNFKKYQTTGSDK
jgi:hypothetical protein